MTEDAAREMPLVEIRQTGEAELPVEVMLRSGHVLPMTGPEWAELVNLTRAEPEDLAAWAERVGKHRGGLVHGE